VQLTGRSHPGQRQPPSRAFSARRVDGDTTRVARPTSTTTEPDLTMRVIVPSQARRSAVRVDTGADIARSAAGAPRRFIKPSRVVVTETCGRVPFTRP